MPLPEVVLGTVQIGDREAAAIGAPAVEVATAGASQVLPRLRADFVLTGSPAGNGLHHGRQLRVGHVMESTITGLGVQCTTCVAPGRDA